MLWNALSKATFKEIFECLTAQSVDLDSVEVGYDETVERNGGVIQQFDELLRKNAEMASLLIIC